MLIWIAGADEGRVGSTYTKAILDTWPMAPSLQSFHFRITRERGRMMITPDQFRFFLDSGAFSAWSRGSVIDIDEYCAFIKANIDHIDVYPCLDVIPGIFGQTASTIERDKAAEATWENFLYMKAEGLNPIAVYHYGEHERHLERMLAYGCDYIGIGGLVGVSKPMRTLWLDRLFKRITDAKGMPIVKTHGFGMTSIDLLFRYPWYSVDSTAWLQKSANGKIFFPAMLGDQFVFDRTPRDLIVSAETSPEAPGHALRMGPSMRALLDRWLAECGTTFAEVSTHYYHRACVNVAFFRKVSELAKVRPFKTDQIRKQSLLGT